MRTPIQAPKANAGCAPCAGNAGIGCLPVVADSGRRCSLKYVDHDNRQRPHRGLSLRVPHGEGTEPVVFTSTAQVRRRDVLGGLIHEYDLAA